MSELDASMDAAEFLDWLEFDRQEPIPKPWEQTGLLASLLYNANRAAHAPPKTPADFQPLRPDTSPQAQAAQLGLFMETLRSHVRQVRDPGPPTLGEPL